MSERPALERVGASAHAAIAALGRDMMFLGRAAASLGTTRFRTRQLFEQMLEIGVRSTFVIVLTGAFTGLVFALQTGYAFGLFQAEALIGPSVVLALMRELSPVLAALMVTARAGSVMASELGNMRVTEQIDALHAMAVSPYAFLVVPRVIAATVMLPLLTALYDFVGFLGAYAVTVYMIGVSGSTFLEQIQINVDLLDLYSGLIKAAAFGMIISVICTSRGFHASGGAKGVGQATTEGVVLSSVAILVADYFLTLWIFREL